MDDTYTDESVDLPDVGATNRIAMEQPSPGIKTLNVARAQHIIDKFTADPSWLADPRTAHAANGVFSAAAKVIGMNLQMERLKNTGAAAKQQQELIGNQIKMANEVIMANPEAMFTAPDGQQRPLSSLYKKDQNGVMPITDPDYLPVIAKLHKENIASTDIQPKPFSTTLPSGATVEGTYNPKTGANTIHKPEPNPDAAVANRHARMLEEDISGYEKKYTSANADYVKSMVGKKVEDDVSKGFKAKADYYRMQQHTKQGELDKLRNPAPAEQKRVRVKGPNGRSGTIVEGDKLPEGWSLE